MFSNPTANIKSNNERMMLCPETGTKKGWRFITIIHQKS